jgi:tRNA (guanosine-2'-O-)-methyltransferase
VSITERREARVRGVLQGRLGSVVVVLEAVNRRHNSSAIIRSCECFGLHEVHLVSGGEFHPSKGAARGSERWLELHEHHSTTACIQGLKARGFRVYAADLAQQVHSPASVPVDGKIAILMGAELTGVSGEARGLVDGYICVPMHGMTESLNVSVAAACIISQVSERKRAMVGGGDLGTERIERFVSDWKAREISARAGMVARVGESQGSPVTVTV